jgi:hypothetical protein
LTIVLNLVEFDALLQGPLRHCVVILAPVPYPLPQMCW